jgi:hypothetical protein
MPFKRSESWRHMMTDPFQESVEQVLGQSVQKRSRMGRRSMKNSKSVKEWEQLGEMSSCSETAYLLELSFNFSITSSRLKLAAFCRCGYSLNVIRN